MKSLENIFNYTLSIYFNLWHMTLVGSHTTALTISLPLTNKASTLLFQTQTTNR